MTLYNEKISNRVLDLLNLPITTRCSELPMLFSRCGLRELQEVFPFLVQSVFGLGSGGVGWGMRTTTKENAPNCFCALVEFFSPMGPMFELCYRLLNDVVKFEFNLDLLPKKTIEFIHSGQHSVFYAELLNIDTFRRQITSLTLNAFDYYLLNFIVHGINPLHKIHPASILIQNELHKTVYFSLTTTYLNWFLPDRPDHIVLPSNICSTVKLPQPLPVQPLQPKRSPKYLRILQSPIYDTASNTANQMNCNSNASRANAWRSESALNLFIDVWLRYDVDETRDLPSSEFLRVVRELIIQVHSFANAVDIEQSSMKNLRKLAQPMLRARFYTFIKSIIERWPLDSSLLVVLELWFSYIQPWRCSYMYQNCTKNTQISINNRFDGFIADNVIVYTQIFIMLLARFERLDFTSSTNVVMLHRLVEVFSQPTLTRRLLNAEESFAGSSVILANDSPSKQKAILNSPSANRDWDNCYNEEVYVPMFSAHVKNEIIEFIKIIYVSRMQIYQEIRKLRSEKKKTNFFKRYFTQLFENTSSEHIKLKEISKIPHILDGAINSLSEIFTVDLHELSLDSYVPVMRADYENDDLSFLNDSNLLDVSRLSPQQMKKKLINMRVGIDPALLPIQTYECKPLVRILHQISLKINQIYGERIQYCWNHSGLLGKIARQLLYAPMTAQWFDKPRGVCELYEEQLPARVCLRFLASYKFLSLSASTTLVGYLFWNAPILSLVLLFIIYFIFIILMALWL